MNDNLLLIGLCTGGVRPQLLARALQALAVVRVPQGLRVLLQVVDSSAEGTARATYDMACHKIPYDSVYCRSGLGRVTARNAVLDYARDLQPLYLAFCDDDAAVDVRWLEILYETLLKHKADVVTDSICVQFPSSGLTGVAQYYKDLLYIGFSAQRGRVWRVHFARAGNVFCRWSVIKGLRFSDKFEQMGEDTDFFYQVSLRGARMVAGAWGLITEEWVSSRACFTFLWQRHYVIGVISWRVYVLRLGLRGALRALYECGGKFIFGCWYLGKAGGVWVLSGLGFRRHFSPAWLIGMQGLLLLVRGLGYLAGAGLAVRDFLLSREN